MNILHLTLFLCIALTVPVCAAVEIPKDLQIITEDYPPQNYLDNGTLKGGSVDLIEEVFHQLGSDINRSSFQVLPWQEGYNLTLVTPDTMLFSTVRNPGRERLFLWAGPIMTDRKVLFMLNDTVLPDEKAIPSLRIVVLKDDAGTGYALQAGALGDHILEALSGEDAVKMVENGSADAFSYGEIAGRRLIDQYAQDPAGMVAGIQIGSVETYAAFNKETSSEFVDQVTTVIQEIRSDQEHAGITGDMPYFSGNSSV